MKFLGVELYVFVSGFRLTPYKPSKCIIVKYWIIEKVLSIEICIEDLKTRAKLTR